MVRPFSCFILLGVLSVQGCGSSSKPVPHAPAPPTSSEPSEPAPVSASEPKPRGPVFDPEDGVAVAGLYLKLKAGRGSAFAQAGLANSEGIPDPSKVELYYKAVKRWSKDPDQWLLLQERAAREERP